MEYKILPFRIDEKTYNEIRKIAYLNEVSMAVIVRSAVKNMLADSKNKWTKDNIAI